MKLWDTEISRIELRSIFSFATLEARSSAMVICASSFCRGG